MTTQQIEKTIGAAPGYQEVSVDEVLRASDVSGRAVENVLIEKKRLVAAHSRGDYSPEHDQRLEDARRDLDVAEAFETALENGEL